MSTSSRYSETVDYDHRFHAGNVGDVLKHFVLRSWLRSLQPAGPVHVIDTHAGAGMFKLPPQGEWMEGIGRLDALNPGDAPEAIREFLSAMGSTRRPGKGGLYPGSPDLLRRLLGAGDRLTVCEVMEEPRDKLAAYYAGDEQVSVHGGDGLAALIGHAGGADAKRLAAFIDPPYVSREEWSGVTDAMIRAREARPDLAVCVWYPIKSLSRPQVMRATLRDAGLSGASVDLISTPLHLKKKRLNGSGLIILDPPAGLLETLGSCLPWLGQGLASGKEWTTSTTSWQSQRTTTCDRADSDGDDSQDNG